MIEDFRRMNFFKGFFTRAEDWTAGQEYHIEKRKFHNRYLHTPGVALGCLEDLAVTAAKEGTALYVAPGYAIDGEGRDLYLPKAEKVPLVPQSYHPPVTVYVTIRSREEEVDPRPNVQNPRHSGHAFVKEGVAIEIGTEEPDNRTTIELARIDLSPEAVRVSDAKDSGSPAANEIDLRHVKHAGVVVGRITVDDLGERVRAGETSVSPSKDVAPSEDDTSVVIERVRGEDSHRFYVVSVYPKKKARIAWRLESTLDRGVVEYRLFFKNFSRQAAIVCYRVYGLHQGSREEGDTK